MNRQQDPVNKDILGHEADPGVANKQFNSLKNDIKYYKNEAIKTKYMLINRKHKKKKQN
tara:strand:+ start:307 stop:483 length:177 start_codon:yes stop_codon:yes gene_type:complete